MPRPERALDPQAGPVPAFAAELRRAREKAGNPTYLRMARATGRSRTALSEAAGGDHLPSWETVEAYVKACGQDPADWIERWQETADMIQRDRRGAQPSDPTTPPQPELFTRETRPWWRPLALLAAAAAAAAVFWTIGAQSGSPAPRAPAAHAAAAAVSPSGPVTVVVQNKVAIGPSELVEDVTPVYLSSRTVPYCSRAGCEVPGTLMWSGVSLQVLCRTTGATMTNESAASAGISRNPGAATSALWYLAQMPNGTRGYISEVYLTPASRGGLGLPACAATLTS